MTNIKYRNPIELDKYIRELVTDKKRMYYVFIDEIQLVAEIQNPYIEGTEAKIGFVDILLGLMKIKNIDLYVTGSNSKMLSSDILTEFKDRGDEVRVYPLSFSEFYAAIPEVEKRHAWREYFTYGGMPLVLLKQTHEEKSKYLKDLFSKTYITDVIERNKIVNEQSILEDLLNIISFSVGSLTNPTKLSNTFRSKKQISITAATISNYALHHLNFADKKLALEKMIHLAGDSLEMIVIGDLMFFDDPKYYADQYDQIGYGPGIDLPCYAEELAGLFNRTAFAVTLDRIHPLVGILKAFR